MVEKRNIPLEGAFGRLKRFAATAERLRARQHKIHTGAVGRKIRLSYQHADPATVLRVVEGG